MDLSGIKILKGQRGKIWGCVVGDLPDDPWVRPPTDSAVQPHTLFLPHSVGARFNHKLRGVHQAVFVHALEVFLVFMDLKIEQITQDRFLPFTKHKLLHAEHLNLKKKQILYI